MSDPEAVPAATYGNQDNAKEVSSPYPFFNFFLIFPASGNSAHVPRPIRDLLDHYTPFLSKFRGGLGIVGDQLLGVQASAAPVEPFSVFADFLNRINYIVIK
ncbi:hypothetical protein KQH82_12915 [bacterium]|nr:hypothetical protein [bacterium]